MTPTEKRPSYVQYFRTNEGQVSSAKISAGSSPHYSREAYACFEANLPADKLDVVKSMPKLDHAVGQLEAACDRLDNLDIEIKEFTKRSASAKQELLKKVLESSEKGRGILKLAKDLAGELDTSNAIDVTALPATASPSSEAM